MEGYGVLDILVVAARLRSVLPLQRVRPPVQDQRFYVFGALPFDLWLSNGTRTDMVVSVHPLCQDLPLKILCSLDTDGASRSSGRMTAFTMAGRVFQ